MKDSLHTGIEYVHRFTIPETKTVPHLYPESDIYRGMPHVFATGFMVGLMEWACVELLRPHLDDGEGSLGIHIDVSHLAPTPPGFEVATTVRLIEAEGRRLNFAVSAHDGVEVIGEGHHQRMVVPWASFNARVADKSSGSGP